MSRLVLAVLLAVAVAVMLACGTAKPKKKKFMPTSETDTPASVNPKDSHFDEVRKAAAAQLECPPEQINIVCLRRDSDGECISIRADGCEKSFEYQFGDT